MITYKIKYKNYISNLYIPEKKSGQVAVLLPGLPASNNINKLIDYLMVKGVVVYYPNFSGSFDSGGNFSANNAVKDVAFFHQMAMKSKVKELYFGKEIEIGKIREVILIGMSFGSAIALCGHKNRYDKVALLSSAFLYHPDDFPNKEMGQAFRTQMISLLRLLKNAFPYSYRIGKDSDLRDFLLGKSPVSKKINMISALRKIVCPTLVLHGGNDTSVPIEAIQFLQEEVKNSKITWQYTDSGHNTSSLDKTSLDAFSVLIDK